MINEQLSRFLRPAWVALLSSLTLAAAAQAPLARLSGPIGGTSTTALTGSRPPLAQLGTDAGVLSAGTAVKGMTLVFSRSAAQEADLQALLAAQQDPASPQYHQWLTPDTFAARFGVTDADLATVEAWLQGQGFSIDGVNRSHNAISFSGSAGQVGTAFATSLHRYTVNGEAHFAPSTDLSVPAALAPMVAGVLHVSDFRPKPAVHVRKQAVAPDFTSSQTQAHYLTPKDVATMYNVGAEYNAGYTGVGQSIAVVGQSYVQTSDVTAFQSAAGLATNAPNLVLVPNTGVAGVSSGDEGESDIDLEYAGGMAPGATVYLVYVGNNGNYGVDDALAYAVTEDIAPVISISYGGCEPLTSATVLNADNTIYAQAVAQGQTILASAGDAGSEACFGFDQPLAVQEQVAVSFPASSPYVTAVGGTQMTTGASTAGSTTYWAAASGTDVASSLLGYVPEVTWNEDSANNGILSGGGGVSTFFTRPTWQTGVPGIPTGTMRLLPDVSLLSAVNTPGFVFCSSDIEDLQDEDLTASCSTGFRDSSGKYLLVAGGTSFAAPIMAGMTALLNQAKHATGQGLLNKELYALASNSATYASVFHDITSGTNACTIASANFCSVGGASEYGATTGYDEATGLGSFNFASLVSAWPSTSATALAGTVTTLAAASATPVSGAADAISINVASATASAGTPTGSVTIQVDGAAAGTVALVNGAATYSYTASLTTAGAHVITAAYSGDPAHAPSIGSTRVTITLGTVAAGSFTFTAANLTAASGTTENSAVAITPAGGYNGNIVFTLTAPAGAPVICYQLQNSNSTAITYAVPVSGVTSATLSISVGTSLCGSATNDPSMRLATVAGKKTALAPVPARPWQGKPVIPVLAGLLMTGFAVRRRSRRLPTLAALAVLTVLGLGVSGCGGNGTGESGTPTTPTPTTASYTLTLTGTDSVTSTIASSTTFTLTL